MKLTAIAKYVMDARIFRLKPDGVKETVEEAFRRVANFIANADGLYKKTDEEVRQTAEAFYGLLDRQDFMPNSPTFTGADTPLGQLSACFVLPIDDTLSNGETGIYDSLRDQALVHQTGGGTGFSFSRLRPRNFPVRRSQGVASGPVSFMKVYNASTEYVKQGGTRRGANMGILRVDHPDILEFIEAKKDLTQINNFNISVGITDAFMAALEAGSMYDLIFDGKVCGQLNAKAVWQLLVLCAWTTGEPGIVFIDRMNRRNPNNHAEVIEATNPCGEQPLPPYGSCNLGSINLANFVKNPYTLDAEVDWHKLRETIHLAVHFLDNVIDMNKYPLEAIAEKGRRDRRIGLGIMGWAEMLVQLGLAYDSKDGVAKARQIRKKLKAWSVEASQKLATERGTYPEWVGSQWHQAGIMMRNATVLTVAPTGTISLIAARPEMPCSGGMEPKFAIVFTRNQAGALMLDIDGQFETVAKAEGWYSEELMQEIADKGSVRGVADVPEKWRQIFVVANEIEPEWHVRMQAAWQGSEDESLLETVCSATSKTINFANSATLEDVATAYQLAWDLGLKGITVYRDGSRFGQVLTAGKKEEPKVEAKPLMPTNGSPIVGDNEVYAKAPADDLEVIADQMIAASCTIGGKCAG